MNEEVAAALDSVRSVIRSRQTFKVLADVDSPVELVDTQADEEFVRQAIADAGWAPFHYPRNVDGVAEPWRCHVLWHPSCRKIANSMAQWFSDMKPNNKLPAMLSACGALVLVTWIPQTVEDISDPEKLRGNNEEHLAAASALVQNLLLICTAGGYGSYWSSGGQFNSSTMFEKLSISPQEKLVAAVFVEYPQTQVRELERLAGKNRDKRAASDLWMREVQIS